MTDQTGGNAMDGVAYRHAQSRQFAAHMLSLPRQGMRPLRKAFDPTQIPELLPRIILRERAPDGSYGYRLVGTELQEYFGQDVTGLPVASGMGDRPARSMQLAFDRMIERPCGLRYVMDLVLNSNQMARIEGVSFPFAEVSPPQQIAHTAVLERPLYIFSADATTVGKLHELEGIDLGAGVPGLSDISW